jgi:DNA modification methylase
MEFARRADTCVDFETWIGDRQVSKLGSNVESGDLPFQSWRNFKEAFAPEIVARAVRETRGTVRRVLDPFGGSGTTALTCQFLGIEPTTIEVNPYLADLIEAKLSVYNPEHIARSYRQVVESVWKRKPRSRATFHGAPPTFVEPGVDGNYIFSRDIAERVNAYRESIDRLESESLRRLFRVLLGSTLIPASNVTVSGKGRRYRQKWRERQRKAEYLDILFEELALKAIHDVTRFRDRACTDYKVRCGDARTLIPDVGAIDLVVSSPPYPNSFDYTDVYNVELWVLGYLRSRAQNTLLRNATIRSHVQIKRDMSTTFHAPKLLCHAMGDLQEVKERLWNRYIPEMISAYFQDMHDVLQAIHEMLRQKGRAYFVVGDSQYAGVAIPVGKILAEIASDIGYRLVGEECFRSMRASPQQGGRELLPETLLVLEKRA